MNNVETVKILQALAEGTHPYTGEVFPKDSAYQHPEVVRALFHAVSALKPVEKPPHRHGLPENAGKPWKKDEDQELIKAFEAGMNIKALAEKHKRTPVSIEARLAKFGKIPWPKGIPPTKQ